jgi:hypothetical protein
MPLSLIYFSHHLLNASIFFSSFHISIFHRFESSHLTVVIDLTQGAPPCTRKDDSIAQNKSKKPLSQNVGSDDH